MPANAPGSTPLSPARHRRAGWNLPGTADGASIDGGGEILGPDFQQLDLGVQTGDFARPCAAG
jgi:hypothetical protein